MDGSLSDEPSNLKYQLRQPRETILKVYKMMMYQIIHWMSNKMRIIEHCNERIEPVISQTEHVRYNDHYLKYLNTTILQHVQFILPYKYTF